MKLALADGSLDRVPAPDFLPTTRTNRLLAVGVALAGAGVIAVNPVAPLIPVAGHQPAVQLTGTWDTAADNWASLQEIFAANPDPLGNAIGELTSYYGDVASNSIKDSLAGVEGIWSGLGGAKGLETILPQVMEFLQQGDTSNAYNLINIDMLFNMQNIFQPLFDHTPRGSEVEVPGIFSMGPDLTRVMANVQDVFFGDYSFWKESAKYLMEPFIGMQYALADSLGDTGDHVAQDPFDALLNGYVPWDVPAGSEAEEPHAAFIGLLTADGTFAYLFDKLPSMIADALTANLPVDEVVDPDLGASLADPNLFDLDWLTGLFS
jgi:hypothetical protein